MKALVVAGGDVAMPEELGTALPLSIRDGQLLVIAADGGLRNAQALGLPVDAVVGDADSLSPETIDRLPGEGIDFQRHPVDKDASDTELALAEALRRGATDVALVGALGGLRFDHALANVLLLANPEWGAPVAVVDGGTTLRVMEGAARRELVIDGQEGDIVSLLPLSGEVSGVHLTGLRYPLDGATMRRGSTLGLSNVLLGNRATISISSGCLVVIHVRQAGPS